MISNCVVDIENDKYFISNQGEVRKYLKKSVDVVSSIPEKFALQVSKLDSEYSQLSNKLDSTFLKRLFELKEGIDERDYNEKIELVRSKIKKLNVKWVCWVTNNDSIIYKRGAS